MNASKELLTYILTLSPEQIDKVVRHLPELVELLEDESDSSPTID